MDTSDRLGPTLPVPVSAAPSLPSGLSPALSGDLLPAASSPVDSQIVWRGLKRYWWKIFSAWLVLSAGAAYSIYKFVQPTYEAYSVLKIEPVAPRLFERVQDFADSRSVGPYLQTQVQTIRSDRVLNTVIADPVVSKLPLVTKSKDPRVDLQRQLSVELVEDAYLIRVALSQPNADDAATIVNTVVQSYMDYYNEYARSANRNLKLSLGQQLTNLESELEKTGQALKELNKKKGVELVPTPRTASTSTSTAATGDGDLTHPTLGQITEAQVATMADQMVRTDFELAAAQATLDVKRQAASRANDDENAGQPQEDKEAFERRITEEFQKDPDVVALVGEIKDTRAQVDRLESVVRSRSDHAWRVAEKHHKQLTDEYEQLWNGKYEEIRKRLRSGAGPQQSAETIKELQAKVDELTQKRVRHAKLFEEFKMEKKEANADALQAALLHYQLNRQLENSERVKLHLQQLEFENKQEYFRVNWLDKAAVPKTATNSKQLKYMAAAPVGILFAVLGLFLVLEISAKRVADPEILQTRIRSQVYALPPLPTSRSVRRLSGPEADDQIEQFIQRLDHLRFGVCGNPAQLGRGRCVLITSAVGGEGKTALAAQLAARCGNAGMSTLLIDADLRRSSLCTLLDEPDGPGLSDILKEEAALDEVVIPVQGGTFYLLRAGTPIKDTSRVLQNQSFAALVTKLRQLYDLVIIDSPPVLPVPDALILGRSADGAVLAARYDISRFPQVERARRQLDSAGIAILGTVINGMRHSDSYYGRYRYNRQRSAPSNSPDTI
jgi:capsular exopolysaccharide synthesis family protein